MRQPGTTRSRVGNPPSGASRWTRMDVDKICDIMVNELRSQDGFVNVDRTDSNLVRFQGVIDVYAIAEALMKEIEESIEE